ncbi:hypothetical protein [Streptomyces sp. NPDC091278]
MAMKDLARQGRWTRATLIERLAKWDDPGIESDLEEPPAGL